MKQIIFDYVVTFGWAVVGSLGMGVALAIALKIFGLSTTKFNEEEELKKGNIAVAIVIASVILGCAWVVSSVIRP